MKIAIVHDWLVNYAGSERVLEQMLICCPSADIFSLVDFVPRDERHFLGGRTVKTSFLQRLPFARKHFRNYLPLMPLAIEQFNLSGYDLVISSSHAVAKGVITGPHQLHLCMCYSPVRYAWDLQNQYLMEAGLTHGLKSMFVRWQLHKLRIWDYRTSNGVDQFIAISRFIARRIHKVYRRDSKVLYPPVDTNSFNLQETKEDFYLTASRMVPYKRIDLIVEAFSAMPDKKLVVIGTGPDFKRIRAKAGPNIKLMGYQPFSSLHDHMRRAKAFVFAAEEDFGIAPLEAQACGTPVIAFGKGGALETIVGQGTPAAATGVFFEEQTVTSLTAAVKYFEQSGAPFDPRACRANALRFSIEAFQNNFKHLLDEQMALRENEKNRMTTLTDYLQN